MNLLERYLRQIEKYLPYKERKETTDELRSLILDQVDEMVASGIKEEDALYNVIKEMGSPRDIAFNYTDSKPFISKEMEPILMLVLKIIAITLPLVMLFANALEFVFGEESFTFMEFMLDIVYNIPSALYSLMVAVGFIFFFFFMIERFIQPKFEVEEQVFIPELLPELPVKVLKVSIFESIVSILFTCLALYLLNYEQGLIAVYVDGNRYPLLNENFDKILQFINIGWIASIILNVYYLFKRKKSIATKTIELVMGIYGAIILFLLSSRGIFNDVVIDGLSLNFIPNIFKIVMIFIGIAVIIGSIVEYIKMFINIDKLEELEQLNKS